MPGNWQWRPRDAKLSSRAFAALASGHNFARGKRDGNPWGEALALLRTPSGQPFYLNLHSSPEGEDSADKKLPGNTLIIGSTGVGKTTLEMFLLTLTRKWDPAPRLVLFDLDRGCEIAIRALGGRYFTLEAGKPTGCNPLQRDPRGRSRSSTSVPWPWSRTSAKSSMPRLEPVSSCAPRWRGPRCMMACAR